MAKQKFASPPERPHPNCKCEIEFVTSTKVKHAKGQERPSSLSYNEMLKIRGNSPSIARTAEILLNSSNPDFLDTLTTEEQILVGASNVIPSAINLITTIGEAALNLGQATTGIVMTLAGWGSQLLGIENDSRAYSDAANEYFVSRYGSVKGFRDAMIQDPVGVAADLSLFVSVTNLALRTGLRAASISSAVKIPGKIESGLIAGSKYLDEFSSALDPLTPLSKEVAHIMSKTQVKEIQDILRIIEEHGVIASRIKTSLGVAGTQGAIENNKKR